jgi:hypothetical protein
MKRIFITFLSVIFFSSFHVMAQPAWLRSGNNVFLGNNIWRVGIGTSTPTDKLHVNTDTAGQNGLRVQIAGLTKLLVHNNGGLALGLNTTPPSNGLYVNGNVGIGTTSPDNKLHVFKGSAGAITGNVNSPLTVENSTHNYIDVLAPSASERGILFGDNLNASDGGIIYVGSTNSLQFRANGNVTRMTLSSIGDLDITGDLDVAGSDVSFGSVETLSDAGANTISSNSNFIPSVNGTRSVGTTSNAWLEVHALNYFTPTPLGNIEKLSYGVHEIMQLRPVSFSDDQNPGVKRLGLIAKEVQQVLPETVRDWQYSEDESKGTLSKVATAKAALEYDAFIPVLIKAMQEQQQTIKNQAEEISAFKDRLAKLEALNNVSSNNNSSIHATTISKETRASLEQNVPNPFNQLTTIRYTIPAGSNSQLSVYDQSGKLVKTLKVTESGVSQINAYELSTGTYTYNLLVNGKLVESKKMIIVK